MQRDGHLDILQNFVDDIQKLLIDPLKRNQVKISWQRELRESKRFQEAENKLKEYSQLHAHFKDNFALHDKVLEALRQLHATRMSQFLEKGKEMSPEECETMKETLSPYLSLLQPSQDIRRLQVTLLSQGKLKKMPLPYDEINASHNEIGALTSKMQTTLMEAISQLSDKLEKVA